MYKYRSLMNLDLIILKKKYLPEIKKRMIIIWCNGNERTKERKKERKS